MPDYVLPTAECRYGYTTDQVEAILGSRISAFSRWFRGQTGSICDGKEWNYTQGKYEPTECGPHGYVIYATDVRRFLERREVID